VVVVGLIIALVSGGGLTTRPASTPEAAALAPIATPTTAPIKIPTSVLPTNTPLLPMPIDTLEPAPTDTPVLPTDTPVPPTNTPSPSAPSSDMVYVPAGEFTMGSEEYSDEQPVHTVYLDAFYIDKTEVTNTQFAQFLSEQGNQEEGGVTWLHIGDEDCLISQSRGQYQPKSGYSDHPVIEVSWYGARAYCEWLGKRLPTEAEWEKAARGADGLIYPWGNTFDGTKLNFADKNTNFDWSDSNWDDGYADTAPVGSYPDGASPYGALDMRVTFGNGWPTGMTVATMPLHQRATRKDRLPETTG
jgi:formylglycine-generating enzyme required for sulfatase activity